MEYKDAIAILDGKNQDSDVYKDIQRLLKDQIKEHKDPENKAIAIYYMLICLLHSNAHFENTVMRKYYDEMTDLFKEAIKNAKAEPDKNVRNIQLKSVYQMIDRFYAKLNIAYTEHGMENGAERSYKQKMDFKKSHYMQEKKYGKWLSYFLWRETSMYGMDFVRWGLASAGVILFFAWAIYMVDVYQFDADGNNFLMMQGDSHPINYIYFSIVTFTTLGYGDILPITLLQRGVVCVQVVAGYIMLGVFLTLMSKKL